MQNFGFGDLHRKEIGDDPATQGYPDDGNGRYIQGKGYGAWYFLNISNRQIKNNQDNLVMFAPLSLGLGLFMPYPTMAMQAAYLMGRKYYNEGYIEKEGVLNQKRMIGAMLCHISTSLLIVTAMFVGFRVTRGRYNLGAKAKNMGFERV